MKKNILLLVCLAFSILNIQAQKNDANIGGHVIEKKTGEHLPYITIIIKGTTIGTSTDATGHYFLKDLPLGKLTLEVKSIGYKTITKEVFIQKGKTIEVNFDLEDDDVALGEVVVASSRSDRTRRLSPTLVNILDVKLLEQTNSMTLSQGLNFQPGIRVETNCQNCGFTQVRMNGLNGPYTQILIDSRPIFSALTGVYGLDQIPANMVDRIEVIRGAGSALFGSSAIAGTINVITKEPTRNSAQLSHTITSIGTKGSFDNNTNFNGSLISDNQKIGVMVFGQSRERSSYDHDGDGFSELPKLQNRTLGFRSFIKTGTYSKISLEYHNMHEFRRGGDNLKKEPFQSYITEQVESDIHGGGAKYEMFSPDEKQRLTVFSSAQLINRKSYYGGGEPVGTITGKETEEELESINNRLNSYGRTKGLTFVVGGQYSYKFDNFLFMPSEMTGGIEYVHDGIDDAGGYRPNVIKQRVNTVTGFYQNEWKNDQWGFLIGARLDKHSQISEAVFNPRANIKYTPIKDLNLRVSYGQGYRGPQLFDEDLHVDIAGGQHIISVRDPNLKKEKSHSLSASADWYHRVSGIDLNFLVEGFFTRLNNPFFSISEDKEVEIVNENGETETKTVTIKTITNSKGSKVYGVNLEARAGFGSLLDVQLGATIQRGKHDDAMSWADDVAPERRILRSPDVYGFGVVTLTPHKSVNTSLSATYTGNMLVPHEKGVIEENRTEKTPSFFDLSWKVTYEVPFYKGSDLEFNAGVQNIFESYQKDFDKGADRASSYIYGPAAPHSFFLGAKLSF